MADAQDKSTNVKDLIESNDSNEDKVEVDKRTFWFMVALVLVCVSLLAICVVLVLWKKVFCIVICPC